MKTLRPFRLHQFASTTKPPHHSFCTRDLRRPLAPSPPHAIPTTYNQSTRRLFTNLFSAGPQTLRASRTIQAPISVVFDIISDVDAYKTFIPFCIQSRVTKKSRPTAADGKIYPEEAELVIGLEGTPGVFSESFWSRVYCAPGAEVGIIETVSGPKTETSLPAAEIAHHNPRPQDPEQDPTRSESQLSHLRTQWACRRFPFTPPPTKAAFASPEDASKIDHETTGQVPGQENTEVNLEIEFEFANLIFAQMAQSLAPKVAEKVIEAFEKRVRMIMEGRAHMAEVQ